MSAGAALEVEQHYTSREVGARLRLHPDTVLELLKPGKIWPVARINSRTIRIPASSVTKFLQGQTWTPRPLALGAGKR